MDVDKSGGIDRGELKQLMHKMGREVNEEELDELLKADTTGDGLIDFNEFKQIAKGGKGSEAANS